MPVAFQAVGTAVSGTASVTAVWPAHQAGDVGILVIETGGEGTTLTPSGWTHVTGSPLTDVATTAGSKLHVLWKVAASSSEANVILGDSGDHQVGRIFTFRGAKLISGNPFEAVASASTATASSTASFPAVTTLGADRLIVMIASRPNDSASTSSFGTITNANLTGITERGEAGTTSGHGGGFKMGTGYKATAGSTGTASCTQTSSTTNVSFTLAMKGDEPPTVNLYEVDGYTTSPNAQVRFYGYDNDGDELSYEIQIDTVNTFDGQ